jgi:hypothetical protein
MNSLLSVPHRYRVWSLINVLSNGYWKLLLWASKCYSMELIHSPIKFTYTQIISTCRVVSHDSRILITFICLWALPLSRSHCIKCLGDSECWPKYTIERSDHGVTGAKIFKNTSRETEKTIENPLSVSLMFQFQFETNKFLLILEVHRLLASFHGGVN